MSGDRPTVATAAEAALLGWKITATPAAGDAGVRRWTWRVKDDHWLSACTEADVPALEREHRLTEQLATDTAIAVALPQAVATIAGHRVVRHAGHGWRVTRHIAGVVPNPTHDVWHRASIRGLAELHGVLRHCDAEPVDAPDTHAYLTPRLSRRDVPEPHRQAADWLRPRWDAFGALPRQLVHGDWSFTNLLADPSTHRLCGVLDWEGARHDPVEIDLGQLASSLLMWTERVDKREAIAALPERYDAATSTTRTERAMVEVAMVAYWLRNYWRSRDDVDAGRTRYTALLERQPPRMAAVLAHVGA